jgi:hypothetical protein
MKTFIELRELTGRKAIGRKVFSKRINRIPMDIHNEMGKFVVYIDGDRLDAYKSQREAEKAGMMFMKQYKGMK